jgi:DNA-binding MarR family transcriptional regulator
MASRSSKQGSEIEVRRELRLLEAIEGDHQLTQRNLSIKLGVALGLTNLYLKRLVRKGYVKCVSVRPNRVRYLLTPKGLAKKARLTYEFMEHSLRMYRKTRNHLRAVLEAGILDGCRTVAIYGTGEPAELAYLSLKELGLEPVAIFDGEPNGDFLGMAVRPLAEHTSVAYDLMIVATLDRMGTLEARLVDAGVPHVKICSLRPPVAQALRMGLGTSRVGQSRNQSQSQNQKVKSVGGASPGRNVTAD